MIVVLLGAPGAGKGTQSELISKKFNIPQISTGELCRIEAQKKSPLGMKIQDVLSKGGLVSDDLVFEILKKRILNKDCQNGLIFDGIPRTFNQAENLDLLLKETNKKIDAVIYINLNDVEIMKRLSGRWTCKSHGHVYHEINNPPKIKGVCDVDGSELYQRDDQTPEAIKERLAQYRNNTLPLIDYYKKKGNLYEINGNQNIKKVSEDIFSILLLSTT